MRAHDINPPQSLGWLCPAALGNSSPMPQIDIDRLLDPEIAEALRRTPLVPMDLSVEKLPGIRTARLALADTFVLSNAVARTDVLVPGTTGDPDVRVRVYRTKAAEGPLPCIFYIHGGGYVTGAIELSDPTFDRWCPSLGCVVVSTDYRKAPETPYPGPLDDCYAGLRWTYEHADELGIDVSRLGIAGASAGGGLAAGLALLARDRGEIPLAFQLLIYPMIDDTMTTESSKWEVPIWAPASNHFGWSAYLGSLFGGDVPAYAAATRATDLAGLPPAHIAVGTLDGFLDEDIAYAQRLNHAGVATELHVYPGAPHGFDAFMPGTQVARRARANMEAWLTTVWSTPR